MNKKIIAGMISALFFTHNLYADDSTLGECKDAGILSSSMITDVPWNAMFPIKLAGVTVSDSGDGAPAASSNDAFCSCSDDSGVAVPGFTQAMFEPARIITLVRQPDCMMALGGVDMNMTNGRKLGMQGENDESAGKGTESSFWHYHYYAYPLLLMLEMVVTNRCGDGYESMDLLYFSELDPTYTDPELSFFTNPESAIFANPISIAACLADTTASAIDQPIDELFWCAGSWGQIYPTSGYISGSNSIASMTSLLATRSIAALHRRLLARKTMGSDALCSAEIYPTIPKSQYKMSMLWPVAEKNDAHQIGEPALMWGEWRTIPSEEDNIYMVWRYNDCCSTFY